MLIDQRPVTIAIDPGIRGAGVAFFVGPRLHQASYVVNPATSGNQTSECVSLAREVSNAVVLAMRGTVKRPVKLVTEWPRAYTFGKQKGDQNDLLPLVGVNCAVAALLQDVVGSTCELLSLHPDEWKHQVPKYTMNKRVWDILVTGEQSLVQRRNQKPPGGSIGLDHNTLDAVGIGLHAVGRLERSRVLPP